MKLIAALMLVGLLVGACGGGDEDDSSSVSGEPTSADGSTGGQPGSTGVAQPTAVPSGSNTGTGSAGSGGVVASLVELTSLPSFRWDITLTGAGSLIGAAGIPAVPGSDGLDTFSANGAWIAPDQAQVEVEVAGFAYKQTIKGDQEWTSIAGVSTGPTPSTTSPESLILSNSFADPGEAVSADQIDCGGTENVNGVDAVRCEATDVAEQEFTEALGQGDFSISDASFVIWIAQDGSYITRWELTASGTSSGEAFDMNVVSNITDVGNVGSIDP